MPKQKKNQLFYQHYIIKTNINCINKKYHTCTLNMYEGLVEMKMPMIKRQVQGDEKLKAKLYAWMGSQVPSNQPE